MDYSSYMFGFRKFCPAPCPGYRVEHPIEGRFPNVKKEFLREKEKTMVILEIAANKQYEIIEELADIHKELLLLNHKDMKTEDKSYSRGFFLGRAFEITKGLDKHPSWWQEGCSCHECMTSS